MDGALGILLTNSSNVCLQVYLLFVLLALTDKLRYNSAVFFALGTNQYNVIVASSDFDFDHPPSNDTDFANCFEDNIAMSMSDFYSGEFERLETEQCKDTYAVDFLAGRGNLIIITNNSTVDNKSLLSAGSHNGPSTFGDNPFGWMCEYLGRIDIPTGDPGSDWEKNCQKKNLIGNWSALAKPWTFPLVTATVFTNDTYTLSIQNITDFKWDIGYNHEYYRDLDTLDEFMSYYPKAEEMQQYLDDANRWKNSSWASNITIEPAGFQCAENATGRSHSREEPYIVDHCRSQKFDEKCQLVFNLPICLAVIFCNAAKVCCMFLTAHDERREIFLTVGDAVSSFMDKPDTMTQGNCLLSKFDITKSRQSTTLQPGKKRWMKSVSTSYWVGTISLYVHLTFLVTRLTSTDAFFFLGFRVFFLNLPSLH